MARTIQDSGVKNADQTDDKLTFQANGTERIDLPSTDFVADAQMTRDGDNLILETSNGETAVIEGYFSADPAPVLHSPDGSVLTPNLVQAFVHSPMEFAANETASDQSPVGAVEEVKGHATVTRADGTVETITNGTPIYQGDVVETDAAGAVNIVFLDETSMAVSANARLAIDQYSYDPSTESGTTNFSVLRGLFVFTSGLIGRDDPDDVKIDTPVGSIGIRGTIIAGEIIPGGESNISVLEGAIVIKNGSGEITLSQQFETVHLSGFDQPIRDMGVVPASEINSRYSSISDVNASLFTMINDAVKEQAPAPAPEAPRIDAAPAEPTSSNEHAPAPQQQAAANEPAAPAAAAPAATAEPVITAPDALASIDSSIPTLDTSSGSGLPSSGTVMGQPSTGLAGTTAAANAPAPSPVIAGTTPPPAAPAGTSPANSAPANTQTVADTQQPPPSVTGTQPAGTVSGPALTFTTGVANDTDAAGTVVGHVQTSTAAAGVGYTFDNGSLISANGYYQLLAAAGGMDIALTTSGAQMLAGSLDTYALGGVGIRATLSDGTILNQSFAVTINDASGSNILNLNNAASPHVSIISDDFIGPNGNQMGYSITALGDINGDGFDDFIASNNSPNIAQDHLYQIMGRSTELLDRNFTQYTNVSTPLTNIATGDHTETIIAGIGDFNGDGIEDYIVGQPNANTISASGNVAIVSGANGVSHLNFTSGPASSEIGASVAGVGDFNNDGYADVIIGAPGADRVYFVGGSNTSWTGSLNSSPSEVGPTTSDFGRSVTGLGDFNGDGYADFAVGAPTYDDGGNVDAGQVRIYGGGQTGTPWANSLGNITGAAGEQLGTDVMSLGDINGDGRSDLLVGGLNNAHAYFGGNTAAPNMNFNVGSYTITGGGGVGDFNGDGYDDFTVSLADANGTHAYVVFGKDFSTTGNYDLNFFKDGQNALELKYSGANTSTVDMDIAGIGDINGDGYDDMAIGVPDANGAANGDGGIIVVYGHNNSIIASNNATAAATGQHLVGTQGNDVLSDGDRDGVSFNGGAGKDIFRLANTNFLDIDGGGNLSSDGMTNYDHIEAFGAGTTLDFTNVDFEKISGVEGINFTNAGQTIILSVENLFNLMKTSDDGIFRISNQGGTAMNLILSDGIGGDDYAGGVNNDADIQSLLDSHSSGNAAANGNTAESGINYRTFDIGGYTLLIDNTIAVDAQ